MVRAAKLMEIPGAHKADYGLIEAVVACDLSGSAKQIRSDWFQLQGGS